MARLARVVVPGYPHHITQRGNRRLPTFFSCVLDGRHALAAVRYVERNPVRARLVRRAWEWPWSSAAGHVNGRGDGLACSNPLGEEVLNWRRFLMEADEEEVLDRLRRHGRTGRPLGEAGFVRRLERRLGRRLRPRPPGRPSKEGK